MEKEKLSKLLNQGYSFNKIAKLENKGITTILYWAKKYSLVKPVQINSETHKTCPKCTQKKELKEFYKKRGKDGNSSYCKSCSVEQVLVRTQLFKSKMIEYKGNKCIVCSYDKYQGALEFHHLDPNKKDFTLSHYKMHSFDDKIKKELDKCALVCANCHREIHGGIIIL